MFRLTSTLARWAGQLDRFTATLKARVAFGALAALVVAMTISAGYTASTAEEAVLRLAQRREHDEAQRLAAVVGRRVAELQRPLALTAAQLQRSQLDDVAGLTRFLREHPVLRAMYANLGVIDASGRVRLFYDREGAREPGVSVADREYFRQALDSGLPAISKPYEGRISKGPLVILAQPLRDGAGPWGVLVGAVDLASHDLLADLSETRTGDDDMMVVVTDDFGTVLSHPERGRLLTALADDPRLGEAALQWLADARPLIRDAGTWTSDREVVAMAGEPLSGWHVWRSTSRKSMLGPIVQARTHAALVSTGIALGTAALLLAYLVWQFRPMAELERRAERMVTRDDDAPWPVASGEIGSLTRTLRHVWAERAQAERFNALVLQKLSSVMAASPVGLAFSRHGAFELVSNEFARLFQYADAALVGQPAALVFAAGDDCARFDAAAGQAFDAGQAYEGEWRMQAADGSTFWARVHARAVVPGDPLSGSIWSLYNIDEQVRQRGQLQHAAEHDALTGLLNRPGFERAAAALFEAAREPHEPRPCAVVMIDLDHFKPVNDRGGHAAGDAMLRAVAEAIAGAVRTSDSVGRLGGDEFAILLPGCDHALGLRVAEKVHAAICDASVRWGEHRFQVGACLGVAELQPAHASVTQWIDAADRACYDAKRAGRNAVRLAA